MSEKTIIAWTDHTANFWMGCHKVSPGCANCYAETLTRNRMGLKVWGPAKTTKRQRVKSVWANVRRWNKMAVDTPGVMGADNPRLVFVGSLMDWAEDHHDLEPTRSDMWKLIRNSRNLHFQMLTKRPERIANLLPGDWGNGYPNVWLGTSIENNDYVWRADELRQIPAVVRFVSYEPALGTLDLLDLTGVDWVIYGGESGHGYRREDKQWARDMRKRCIETGVAFFHKQSSGYKTEMGIELDGEIVREYPIQRITKTAGQQMQLALA